MINSAKRFIHESSKSIFPVGANILSFINLAGFKIDEFIN
ncbi:hypothetical protein SALWKB2_1641 [Snodgrassella alvi wkB2]|nr:hypothetical protein SALWKB2_1641 [Snodgrassella alvi wkB2]